MDRINGLDRTEATALEAPEIPNKEPPGEGAPALPATQSASPKPESWEMQLGTVWLARIGIVILITGLVFLGNYAWHNIVAHLGAGGRVALLLVAAGAVGGLGFWMERRQPTLRRYAQVLMAGGAATAYYTTYAAYFVRPLQIIQNPVLAGLLLLLVGGLFLWWSDRRRLETTALLAVGLSYYTAAINPVGDFTLFSSLLLTLAAGFLLVRRGWALVSWVSLAGTYGSYLYWQDHGEHPHGLVAQTPWLIQLGLLCTYWVLFTGPVFWRREAGFSPARRTVFLTLNNALFFWLAAGVVRERAPGSFWLLALVFGVVLLGLAALAWQRRAEDFTLDGAYLAQGLAAVTAGLAAKLSGPSLAIALAVESLVLLTNVAQRHGWIYRLAASALATWAFWLALDEIGSRPEIILPMGSAVAVLLTADAWWLKKRLNLLSEMRWHWSAAGFALLGLLLAGNIQFQEVYTPWEPAAFTVAALLCTGSIYLLRLPEVTLLGQGYLVVAALLVSAGFFEAPLGPWWSPVPVVAGALVLSEWWSRQRMLPLRARALDALQLGGAACAVAVGACWMQRMQGEANLMLALGAVGLGTLGYGLLSRHWALLWLGEIFGLISITVFLRAWDAVRLPCGVALVPVLLSGAWTAAMAAHPQRFRPKSMTGEWPAVFALANGVVTALLSVGWVFGYVDRPWQLLTLALLGTVLVLSAIRWPRRVTILFGLAYFGLVYAAFVVRFEEEPRALALLALLLAPGVLRFLHRLRPDAAGISPSVRHAAAGLTTGTFWLWVTRWMLSQHRADLLTVAWSALAVLVFVAGLTLRERVYRLGGFLILGLAVGRVFLVDVWRLETIYRIVSFLVLGVVLLALGFIYNRYADQIRRWL